MNTLAKTCILVAAVGATGCASIVSNKQKLTFNSEPGEATVSVAGKAIGKTPLTADVDRAKETQLTIEKEGYKPFSTQLSTTLNGWFWGNILIGGLLGSTTDAASGSMYEYSPSQYFITLTPDKPFGMESNRPRDVKQLMIASASELRVQLANDGGEHVNALLKLLEIQDADKARAVDALKKISAATPDDLEFAKKVIEVYGVK